MRGHDDYWIREGCGCWRHWRITPATLIQMIAVWVLGRSRKSWLQMRAPSAGCRLQTSGAIAGKKAPVFFLQDKRGEMKIISIPEYNGR
jgi:hypothetical protein